MRLVFVLIVALLFAAASAKKRKHTAAGNTHIQGRKRECETECLHEHDDHRPNCIMRCQSEACYTEVYAEELEPGEIDLQRQRAFQTCITNEARNMRPSAAKQRAKQQVAEDESTTGAREEEAPKQQTAVPDATEL